MSASVHCGSWQMTWMKRIGLLVTLIAAALLTGCCANTPATDYCYLYKIVTVTAADQITDETAEIILENNQSWGKLCQ